VADWILRSEIRAVGAGEAMVGLGGRADRPRLIEALVKLAEIGALEELPRVGPPNSKRMFERVESPYWAFAANEIRIALSGSVSGGFRGK
jgi:hypothetical protein